MIGLVERGGQARMVHLYDRVTSENVREIVTRHADPKSRLHTDESRLYPSIGTPLQPMRRSTTLPRNTPVAT